jgi:hypothetical protein
MLKLELKNLVSEWLSRFVQSPGLNSAEKSSRARPWVRTSARGRASERPFFQCTLSLDLLYILGKTTSSLP